jgi:iron complex transport system permease protein
MLTRNTLLILLGIVLLLLSLLSLSIGAFSTPFSTLLNPWREDAGLADLATTIVFDIRLPRLLLSGAAMQGLFRNPLADPSLIGVTAGASLGASVAIVFIPATVEFLSLSLVSLGAFVGGLTATLFVYALATRQSGFSVSTMLLVGIAITALAGSLGNLLDYFANNSALRQISLWRMGGLDAATPARVLVLLPTAIALIVAVMRYSNALNALLLGDSQARYLGFNIQHIRTVLIVVVAIAVSTSVAMAGTIAFVGLVVPHLIRLMIGPNYQGLVAGSAMLGAVFLIAADLLARTVIAPAELPVGIVTALIGVPFFITLLRRRRSWND